MRVRLIGKGNHCCACGKHTKVTVQIDFDGATCPVATSPIFLCQPCIELLGDKAHREYRKHKAPPRRKLGI